MNNKLNALWAKIVEHKEIVIRVGCAVGGALVGVGIANMIHTQAASIDHLELVESLNPSQE